MATELLLIKDKGRLTAAEPCSAEAIDAIAQDTFVTAKISFPRHPKHHRKFFVLLNEIVKNTDKYFDEEDLLNDIKINIGHSRKCKRPDGSVLFRPKSISFSNMPQDKFKKFYDAAVKNILEEILPDIGKDDLESHILEMMGEYHDRIL